LLELALQQVGGFHAIIAGEKKQKAEQGGILKRDSS